MAKIDQLLTALRKRRADALILVAGEQAHLKFEDGMKPLTSQAVDARALRNLLAEVLPPRALDVVDAGRSVNFRHEVEDSGTFAGVVNHSGGILAVSIVPFRLATISSQSAAVRPVEAPEEKPAAAPSLVSADGDRYEIDMYLRAMVTMGGSDLHIGAGSRPMVRVDGSMTPIRESRALLGPDTERLFQGLMPERNRQQFETHNDTDFAHEIPELARFRVNVFRDRSGIGGVCRVIPHKIMSPEELGLPASVQELCSLAKGLVLVTGPTGSGKSTTLATMIDIVNRTRRDHIITIEDPIEFVHPSKGCHVNQREVGVHTDTFKSALRAALREDPDVVLVGEMRDLETTAIAIETAVTGHLVFATLHTSTAMQTVDRVIDQFPGDQQQQIRVMLADCLKGVVSQTLLKKKGGGRIAALEVMLGIPSVCTLIREGKTFQLPSVLQTNKGVGMNTLNDVLVGYVHRGIVDAEEAYAKAVDRKALRDALDRKGHKVDAAAVTAGTERGPSPISLAL